MWWVIWVLLLVLSSLYLGARLWGLWGQTKELGSELAVAQRRIDEVQGQVELLEQRTAAADELAVFASPAAARKERESAREAGRSARQRRRASSSPAWAKHVD